MTVFKSFFKVASKNIGTIILYTVLLVLFGGIQFKSNDTLEFSTEKPDVIIVDKDESVLSKNLVSYFNENAIVIDNYDNIDDTIFYRQANYYFEIYKGYEEDVLNGNLKNLKIKTTGDYMSSLSSMMLNRYLKVQEGYAYLKDTKQINEKVNNVLNNKTKVELKSKLKIKELSKLASYYNFASYSIVSSIVLVITLIISSYNNINIRKRTIISSQDYKTYNKQLILAASIYAIIVWIFYNILGFILNKDAMLNIRGLLYVINSFVYTFVNLLLAILISSVLTNKNAINGIVNVLAVGSSFLCGVFVPTEWLGKTVLKIAHIFPTFYYVDSNNLISKIEVINFESIKPIINNTIVLLVFVILFILINNIITRIKRKIG